MTKQVKKFKGSQGSWEVTVDYTDGSREILPCVHQHFFRVDAERGYCYDNSWEAGEEVRKTAKFAKHVELIRSKKRVVLTSDDVDESRGRGESRFKRTGYIFVSDVADVVVDNAGLRFRFVGTPLRKRR